MLDPAIGTRTNETVVCHDVRIPGSRLDHEEDATARAVVMRTFKRAQRRMVNEHVGYDLLIRWPRAHQVDTRRRRGLPPEEERNLARVRLAVEACFGSRDYSENRLAFMQKMKPDFRGS